ncbi:MAG: hypothetical protein ACIAQU_09460 [Phycisphaerales bacterium JB064]
MTLPIVIRVAVLVLAVCPSLATAQEAPPDQQARMDAMIKARHLAMAVTIYAHTNSAMPADVKTMADHGILSDDMGTPSADGSALIVDGVSYGYLGVEGVSPSEVPDWGDIAIAYRSLEHPFAVEPTPDNPDGALVPVAFLDGHVEMVSMAEARWLIEDAKETFTALRDGGPMPIYRQLEIDASRIAQAMLSYAAQHDGAAPPDWAATYAHLDANPRNPDESDADRLRIFLSPKSRDATFIPQFESEAERDAWINANSMWRTDTAGANLWQVPNPMFTVLIYTRPDVWVEAPDRRLRKHVRRHAFATVDARGEMADLDLLKPRISHASELYTCLRDGTPLPPFDDAMHDLRVLSRAIAAYAQANKGFMPPDLGEVMPYVGELWGVHDRQPARIFLIRDDENEQSVAEIPDAEWIRAHCSYVYLGDGNLRLRDLRGSDAGVLIHAPLDRPFDFTVFGENQPRVPYAGPLLRSMANGGEWAALPMFAFPPDLLAEQVEASREAIRELAGN